MSFVHYFKIAGAAIGLVAAVAETFKIVDDRKKKQEEREKKEKLIPEETIIEYLNELSNTMTIVYHQLAIQAIDMTEKDMKDQEICDILSDKFKCIKEKAEQNLCNDHGILYENFKFSIDYYEKNGSQSFRKALLPCNYLLSILKNQEMFYPNFSSSLTIKRVLLISNAIAELTFDCIDRIVREICMQLKCDSLKLAEEIRNDNDLREHVMDMIVDAEKECKKKVLTEQGIEEADFILFNIKNRTSEQLTNGLNAIDEKKQEKLKDLGLL